MDRPVFPIINIDMEIRRLYQTVKSRAKKKGLEFDLTLTFLNEMSMPISCPILGIPINYYNRKQKDDSPSIDRIDSTKGYTQDNVWIISWRANRLKNNATDIELRKLADVTFQADG